MKEDDIAGSVQLLSEQMKKGKTPAECREILVQAGYSEANVSAVMQRLKLQNQTMPNSQPKNTVQAPQKNNNLLIVSLIIVLLVVAGVVVVFVLPMFAEQVESQSLEASKAQLDEVQVISVNLYEKIISDSESNLSEINKKQQEDISQRASAVAEGEILELDKRIFLAEIMLANRSMVDDVKWLYAKEKASYEKGKQAETLSEVTSSKIEVLNNEIFLGMVVLWNVIVSIEVLGLEIEVEEDESFLGFEHEYFKNRISEAEPLLNKNFDVAALCAEFYSESAFENNRDIEGFKKIFGQAWLNANKPALIEKCESLTAEYITLKKQQFRDLLKGEDVAEQIYYAEVLFTVDTFVSGAETGGIYK